MNEIRAILTAYQKRPPGVGAALATVVRVEGSSYRRAGARMLILANGTWVGGISGGCLEGDALTRARLVMAEAKPALITYDTTQDDAYQIGVGLGCNGIIDVLITPIDPDNPFAIRLLEICLARPRQTHVLLTVHTVPTGFTGVSAGDVCRYTGPDSLAGFGASRVITPLSAQIETYLAQKKSAPLWVDLPGGGSVGIFVELLLPAPHVVVLGQQYDVYPLVRLLAELGWQATVMANPHKLIRPLLAQGTTVVAPANFESVAVDEQTAFVLMAHDYATDRANLARVVQTAAPFIGVLGPRVRTERMVAELAQTGVFVPLTERIHAPVGLDIGATSPEEIALSVVAEIRAVLAGRNGLPLRLRQAPIHEREPQKN